MPLINSQIEDAFAATDEDVKTLLSNILNLNLGNDSSEQVIIGTINKLLSVSKNRLQGLEFLNLIINNCSSTIISENAFTWISHCLIDHPGDNLKEIKLSTIGKIVENVYSEQEFAKRFISECISKVLDNCLSDHGNFHESEAAIKTLSICMKHYGSWFAPHKMKIETFLINLLENSSERIVEKAAVAFHYLQQTGRAGIDGVNYKTNFSTNFGKLCATLQKLFDKFFENETEIDHSNRSDQDGFEFIDLPHYSQKMLHIRARRIRNCLKFIMTMLIKRFPVAKEIKPTELLDIINRGTAIHQCLSMGNERTLEDFQFSLLLNKIQVQLLQLLRIFIIWGQTNLLPFSFIITKIQIDCLKKSQNCHCFKTDSLYQEVVYKVLGCWLRISKNSLHGHFQTQLVTCIMKDITPVENSVTLTLQSDTPKNKSTKAKRKAIQERIIASGQDITSTETLTVAVKHYKEKTCLCALNTLKHLLSISTLKIDPDVLKNLCTSIISTMNDIQISKLSHPYTNNECQAKLYEVFVMFYEHDTLKIQPPLKFTLGVLSKGVNDKNRHIALTCEYGLSLLEKLCQPVCPSLSPDSFTINELLEEPETTIDYNDDEDVSEMHNQIETGNENVEVEESIEQIMQIVNENIEATTEVNLREANIEVTETNEEEVQHTLVKEKSIHILDVRIVKSPIDEEVTEDANVPDAVIEDTSIADDQLGAEVEVGPTENEDHTIEVNIFKNELLLSETSIHLSSSPLEVEKTEVEAADDEPPLKKCKLSGSEDAIQSEIKEEAVEETKNLEEEDDRFEEDDAFVDEVKKY